MDSILILDKDEEYVHSLQSGLNKMRQFEVQVAVSGQDAIQLLETNNFSVFVSEVFPKDLDVLDLLSFMTQKRPHTPCIITTDHGKPWYKEQMAHQSFLYHLEKPFTINMLASAIIVGLNLRDEGRNFRGMTVPAILPLAEILQKTGRMVITSKEHGKGYLYFNEGDLIDAHFKELSGDAAAREIVKWDQIFFTLDELPRCRTRARIKTRLMDMANASWEQKREKNIGAILLTMEQLSAAFNKNLKLFNQIKGYRALAVIGEEGEILASDQADEKINIHRLADDLKKFFSASDKTSDYINFDQGTAVTLQTQDSTIIIVNPRKKISPRIRLVGVAASEGNWFYMKMNLEKLLDEIIKF